MAIILASGPSLTDEDIAIAEDSGHSIIAVNTTYQRCDPDYIVAGDKKWWDYHFDNVPDCSLWTVSSSASRKYGINKIPYYSSHNSGVTAIKLAIHLGEKNIILLGFDCKPSNGLSHWHGDHPEKILTKPVPDYIRWKNIFNDRADDLKRKAKIINCSRETALTCFPKMSLREALNEFN